MQPTQITITCPRVPKCAPPTTQPRMLTDTSHDVSIEPPRNKRPRLNHPADTLDDYLETTPDTISQAAPHSSGPSSTQDYTQLRTGLPTTFTIDATTTWNNTNTSTAQDHTHHNTLPDAALPFYDDFRGTWWNAQALFASDPILQTNKQRHAWSLLAKTDFIGFAETHSTIGHTQAASLPDSSEFFWSHGPTRWQAGVGLAVKHTFLQKFKQDRRRLLAANYPWSSRKALSTRPIRSIGPIRLLSTDRVTG